MINVLSKQLLIIFLIITALGTTWPFFHPTSVNIHNMRSSCSQITLIMLVVSYSQSSVSSVTPENIHIDIRHSNVMHDLLSVSDISISKTVQ